MNDKVTIKIPRQLYGHLQREISNSGFNSVTDYIVFILRELVADKNITGNNMTVSELENIKRRLKNLGYM